jgi:hydrogenase small subunit
MVSNHRLSRRDFLKLSAGSTASIGLLFIGVRWPEELHASENASVVAEVPVIWLQGGSCAGCSVSVLNSLSPKIQDVLVSQVIPGQHVSLRFHPNIMAAAGDLAMTAIEDAAKKKGGYLLVVEGTVPTKDGGVYCEVGEENGHGIPFVELVAELGGDAMAVIALGTCATYGGIPAAAPNPTGSKGVKEIFTEQGIGTPVINVSGCPPHPDWFIGTVVSILIGGLASVEVDSDGRPLAFYGKLIHDNCPRRGHFDAGQFSQKYSDPYCMYQLGCKGPVTHADCPIRLWNSGTNWCVGANSLCIGCAEPGFPDTVSPFMESVPLYTITPPSWLPPIEEEEAKGFNPGLAAGIGAATGLAAGAAAVAIGKRSARQQVEEKVDE